MPYERRIDGGMPGSILDFLKTLWAPKSNDPQTMQVLEATRGGLNVFSVNVPDGERVYYNAMAPLRASSANPSFTSYAIKNPLGFKAFTIEVPKLSTDDFLVFGWSTAADDETALGAILESFCDEMETAAATLKAGAAYANVDRLMLPGSNTVVYDGETTIKTIMAVISRTNNATPTATAPVAYGVRAIQ